MDRRWRDEVVAMERRFRSGVHRAVTSQLLSRLGEDLQAARLRARACDGLVTPSAMTPDLGGRRSKVENAHEEQ